MNIKEKRKPTDNIDIIMFYKHNYLVIVDGPGPGYGTVNVMINSYLKLPLSLYKLLTCVDSDFSDKRLDIMQ